MRKRFALFLIPVLLSGCASLKVQYDGRNPDLPELKGPVTIATWDQREQVLDGSRQTDFVGYSRTTVGIAYPIGTTSGNPVSDDISSTIASSLQKKGSSTTIIKTTPEDTEASILERFRENGGDRLFLLKCEEHKIDGYGLPILHFELETSVFGPDGSKITGKHFSGERNLGEEVGWGRSFNKYKEPISEGLEDLLEEIFEDPDIAGALK
jgi:hypothetical protein